MGKSNKNTGRHVSVEFLDRLRQGGPWTLSAIEPIEPDKAGITTKTLATPEAVEAFVAEFDGQRNLYYNVNPLRRPMNKKAAKNDIATSEYLFGDLDPAKGESPDDAKARYIDQLNGGSFQPRPTALIDSGNGLQALWRLDASIPLNGDDKATTDVEERTKAIMQRLGSKAGTQDICRILRLPGTQNLPTPAKLREGREPCAATLLWFEDTTHPLDAFPLPAPDEDAPAKSEHQDGGDQLADMIVNGVGKRFDGDRSKGVWYVMCEMLRRGYLPDAIVKVLLDKNNGISAHIYDQHSPKKAAQRQVEHAIKKIDFARDENDKVIARYPSNIRIGLVKLGVVVRYDTFADRTIIEGLPGFGPALDDAAVIRLWLTFDQRFGFRPAQELMLAVLGDTARLNSFHPVRDFLDGVQTKWDGVLRVDEWLIKYAGAEDSPYVRAVSALMLIAAVRRVRRPGCKFDEMVVIEQPTQGTDKSTALAVLAVEETWFADHFPLHGDDKKVIEVVRGKWIIECAELSGMKKADVETLKALLSRQTDRGRMAYGRLPIEVPRQCVFVGTTNKTQYLRDTSGNRRYWPVRIVKFDLGALRRDRGQLWAEAATREAAGEPIRLARELWPAAAEQQALRLADDPFVPILQTHLDKFDDAKIRTTCVLRLLGISGASANQDSYQRVAEAMKRIGWRRPNKSGMIRFAGDLVVGYVKGAGEEALEVSRSDVSGTMKVFRVEDIAPTGIDR